MKNALIIISFVLIIPSIIFAENRLVIKDDSGATRFKIEDDGSLQTTGSDDQNDFPFKIAGKAGGDNHTGLITGETNSRITIMASEVDDRGPRLHMIGPQDVGGNKGTALFDFGSGLVDLDEAEFRVRHHLVERTGVAKYVDMIRVFGREAVTFPNTDAFVGIQTENPQYPLQVTTSGAYCDGNQWFDKSSRESKENIAALSKQEAFETLRNIKPVKFNYKTDAAKETNVGFIAEDVPELVANQDRKGLASMEMVAVLTKVVQEQQEMISKLNDEVQRLKHQIQADAGS